MRADLQALRSNKPRHGADCNRCGYCCTSSPCPLAMALLGLRQSSGGCPALEWDGERSVCGIAEHPERYAPVRTAIMGRGRLRQGALDLIGSGTGCDTIAVGERRDVRYELRMEVDSLSRMDAVKEALRDWGIFEEVLAL